MARVSVVIPTYNCAQYLRAAVDSVLAQHHKDFEVIVVDDGSTDGTEEALADYQGKLRYVRTDNAGVAAARNRGLTEAAGDFVAFLDADDWWDPWKLTVQLAALAAFPEAGLVFSDFSVSDLTGRQIIERGLRWKYGVVSDAENTPWTNVFSESKRISWTIGQGNTSSADAYHGRVGSWLFRGNMINTSSVLLRRDVINQIGTFDRGLTTEEDYDYWLRVARCCSMIFVDEPLLNFRRRPGQLTEADQIERILGNVATVLTRASTCLDGELDQADINNRIAGIHRELCIVKLRQSNQAEARRQIEYSLQYAPKSRRAKVLRVLAHMPAGLLPGIEKLWRKINPRHVPRD